MAEVGDHGSPHTARGGQLSAGHTAAAQTKLEKGTSNSQSLGRFQTSTMQERATGEGCFLHEVFKTQVFSIV